ncbi:MAG: hypothetical protein ACO390_18000, partial [bacterium]
AMFLTQEIKVANKLSSKMQTKTKAYVGAVKQETPNQEKEIEFIRRQRILIPPINGVMQPLSSEQMGLL